MKTLLFLFGVCMILLIGACEVNNSSSNNHFNNGTSVNDLYRFFPQKNGNHWFYSNVYFDSLGKQVDSFDSKSVYSQDSGVINSYTGNFYLGWMQWQTSSGAVRCCGGITLINYYNLDCNSDSILIDSKVDLPSRKIYQYCVPVYLKNLLNYEKVKCIHTKQINTETNGRKLIIDRYYGYDVGLIYEVETYYASNGVQRYKVIKKIKRHQF